MIGLYRHWYQKAEQCHILEKQKIEAEHAPLKSQVSPQLAV